MNGKEPTAVDQLRSMDAAYTTLRAAYLALERELAEAREQRVCVECGDARMLFAQCGMCVKKVEDALAAARAEVERAARFCYIEAWNDMAQERGSNFTAAWSRYQQERREP